MRRLPLVSALALALAACATAPAPAPVASAASPQVPSQLPRHTRPLHYTIAIAPDAANLRFTGTTAIDIDVLEPTDTIVVNAAELDFASVAADGGRPPRVSTDAEAQTATLRVPD